MTTPPIWETVRTALRDGDPSAIARAEEALQSQKPEPEIASALNAQLLWGKGERDKAKNVLKSAAKVRDLGPHEKLVKAHLLLDEQKLDDASKMFEEAKKGGVKDPRIAAGFGHVAYEKKKPKDAIRYFEEALRQDPKLWHARYLLGSALTQVGETNKASAAFEQVTKDRRDFEPAWRAFAATLLALKKPEAAVKALEGIAQEHPDWPMVQIAFSDCLEMTGAIERSIQVLAPLTKTINNPDLILHYAELCVACDQMEAATTALGKLSNEKSAGVHLLRGRIAEMKGNFGAALTHYKKAQSIDPANGRVKNALGLLLLKETPVKDWTEAGKILEDAVKAQNPPAIAPLLNLAILRAQEGRNDEAKKLAEQVLAQKPADPSIIDQAKRVLDAASK